MADNDEARREQLIEHLIDEGAVSADDMQRHLLMADRKERPLVDVLYDEVDESADGVALAEAMADLFDADVVDVDELDGHPATMTVLPESLARERGVLGCADPDRDDQLALVVYDPIAIDSLMETIEAAAGAAPRVFLAPREPLLEVIGEFYEAFDSSNLEGEELPVASVLSGVRPLDISVTGASRESDESDESELGADASDTFGEAAVPSDDADDEEGGESLDDDFGEDLERAVSDSLDDLGGMFDEENDEWLEEDSEVTSEEESDSDIRYRHSAADDADSSDSSDDKSGEKSRPAVGAEKRGSTPFGDVVEPSASLDEDTATGDPDQAAQAAASGGAADESEPVIDTSPQGSGPDVEDAFADAWPDDDDREASGAGDIETDVTHEPEDDDTDDADPDEESLGDVIDVADELSGPRPDSHDPELSQSTSRKTLIEMVETHGRMLKRLNRKISYQKRLIEEVSRLLVETRVVSRADLFERLKKIRKEFVDEE